MADARPPPLRTDGSNPFARYSMQVRVPRILRDVLDHGPPASPRVRDAVERLAREIEDDAPLPAPSGPAPDLDAWVAAHAEHARGRWLHAEWFHAELAVYRELAARWRFWETGVDPFADAKHEELSGERPWAALAAGLASLAGGRPRDEQLHAWLLAALWGNRVDLSYAVAAGHTSRDGDLLVDDRAAAVRALSRPGARVHVVADNAGTELAADLALVDAILGDPRASVTLHVKMQPVFVSDALAADVWSALAAMASRPRGGEVAALGARLRAAFDEARLVLAPGLFWSGPRFLWEAPPSLAAALREADVVLLKGDANYRRVVGDALWPPAAPFAAAAAYVGTTVVARTMKSDAVVGLPEGLAERLDAEDAEWRVNGKRGVIQAVVAG